jgi:hypothetical protein
MDRNSVLLSQGRILPKIGGFPEQARSGCPGSRLVVPENLTRPSLSSIIQQAGTSFAQEEHFGNVSQLTEQWIVAGMMLSLHVSSGGSGPF